MRWQRQEHDSLGNAPPLICLARPNPVAHQQAVRTGSNLSTDFGPMFIHRLDPNTRHNDRHTNAAAGRDRPEDVNLIMAVAYHRHCQQWLQIRRTIYQIGDRDRLNHADVPHRIGHTTETNKADSLEILLRISDRIDWYEFGNSPLCFWTNL